MPMAKHLKMRMEAMTHLKYNPANAVGSDRPVQTHNKGKGGTAFGTMYQGNKKKKGKAKYLKLRG